MKEQKPDVREDVMGKCDPHKVYSHPAYGTVTMSIVHGGNKTLFGSDLGHSDRVCIRVNHAELKRDLNHDWIHSRGQLIEFEMSHAQFAQFITSQGNGSGTPVTLRWIHGQGSIPAIENIETKHETFRREIREAAHERLQHIDQSLKSLDILLNSGGSVSKKELREIYTNLARHAALLPGTLEFVVKSGEEALEKATSDAKIEVESYMQMAANRIGLNHISDLAEIEQRLAINQLTAEGQAQGDYNIESECSHIYSRAINQPYPRLCVKCGKAEGV